MAKGWSFGAFIKNFDSFVSSLGELAKWNKNSLYDAMYPTGIVVMFNIDADPNKLFPGTTWSQLTDYGNLRTSKGNDIGQTQGADLININVENLPSHNHGWSGSVGSTDLGQKDTSHQGDHSHDYSGTVDSVGDHSHHMNFNTQDAGNHNHYIPGNIPTQDGNTRAISGGSVGQWSSNKGTSDSGNHNHHIDAYTENGGGHAHGFRGTTTGAHGWGNNGEHWHQVVLGSHGHSISGTVSNTGANKAINTAGRVHNVSAWVRTK